MVCVKWNFTRNSKIGTERELLQMSIFNQKELMGFFLIPCISCIYNVKYISISLPKLLKKYHYLFFNKLVVISVTFVTNDLS